MSFFAMIIVTLCFWPWFHSESIPFFTTDGAFSYFTYKSIYTDLITSGAPPLWNFATSYGQPMQSMYIYIGPTKYLTMAIGALFGITNVYLLFVSSILIELSVLIFGVMLLAKHMRIHPLIAVTIAVSLALITKWQSLYYFRHHVLIGLPLMFYYGIRFSENMDFRFLALNGLLLSLFFFDGTAYQPIHSFYQVTLFVIVTVCALRTYRSIGRSPHYLMHPTTILLFVSSVVIGGLFFYTLQDLVAGNLVTYRNGRLPDMTLSLSQFQRQIHLESSNKLQAYRRCFYSVGTVPLVFFISAIYHSAKGLLLERKYVIAFGILMIISALAVFDSSGLITRLFYILPGMKFYRYGDGFLTYAMAAFMIIAMFGMNHYFMCQKSGKSSYIEILFALALLVIGLFLFDTHAAGFLSSESKASGLVNAYAIAASAPLLQLAGFAAMAIIMAAPYFFKPAGKEWRHLAMILFLVIEIIVSVTFWVYGNVKHLGNETLLPRGVVSQTFILPKMLPPQKRDDKVYRHIDFTQQNFAKGSIPFVNTSRNAIFLSAERLYPCVSMLDSLFIDKRIESFFRLYAGFDDQMIAGLINGGLFDPQPKEWIEDTPTARRLLGCDLPIVRLAKNISYTINNDSAATLLHRNLGMTDTVEIPEIKQVTTQAPHIHFTDENQTSNITMKKYWGNEINFIANNYSKRNGWAIITDTFDEHWHAWVDGRHQPVRVANIAFKAVEVPPGKSEVILKYQNNTTLVSIWSIAIITVFLFVLFYITWLAKLGGWHD